MTKGDETMSDSWKVWGDEGGGEVNMTEARKMMALWAIDLIMEHYLPSLGGGRGGKEPHTLDTWGEIRKIVADSKED